MITMKKTLAAMIAAISISGTAVMAARKNRLLKYRIRLQNTAHMGKFLRHSAFRHCTCPGWRDISAGIFLPSAERRVISVMWRMTEVKLWCVLPERAAWRISAPYLRHNGIRGGHFEKYMGGVLEKRAICIFRLRGAHDGNWIFQIARRRPCGYNGALFPSGVSCSCE